MDAILRSDLYAFIQAVFPLVSPNDSLKLNWHLQAMANALSGFSWRNSRLIITVPPRHLKSICTSVAFPAFALGHNPQLDSFAQVMPKTWPLRIPAAVAILWVRRYMGDYFRTLNPFRPR